METPDPPPHGSAPEKNPDKPKTRRERLLETIAQLKREAVRLNELLHETHGLEFRIEENIEEQVALVADIIFDIERLTEEISELRV